MCSKQGFLNTFLVFHYFNASTTIFLLTSKTLYVYILSQIGHSIPLQSWDVGKPALSETVSKCIFSISMATIAKFSEKTWIHESTLWRKFQDKWLKLAGVTGHFSTNPINSHVETTKRLLHKLGKLKSFNMKFSLVIETALSFRMRGKTPWNLIPMLKYHHQKKKSMLAF